MSAQSKDTWVVVGHVVATLYLVCKCGYFVSDSSFIVCVFFNITFARISLNQIVTFIQIILYYVMYVCVQ